MFSEPSLVALLKIAAAIQAIVSVLNLQLCRWLGWNRELAQVPLLIRQVFHVHSWFISL